MIETTNKTPPFVARCEPNALEGVLASLEDDGYRVVSVVVSKWTIRDSEMSAAEFTTVTEKAR